jgi:CRISPR-associated protein Cst1
MAPRIQYVGDPFVDAGVAVLEYRLKKQAADFDLADLERQAAELEIIYARKAWAGYLTCHFPNSSWCNFTMGVENRRRQRDLLLRAFDIASMEGRECVYCQRSAQQIADRSSIPLITGAANMTTGPGGQPGMPVCSSCLYAIQFYPLAAMKVEGRPLFWWTAQRDWMFSLTGDFALRVAQLVEASPEQVPSMKWPSTRLFETAEKVIAIADEAGGSLPLVDMIGCHATNYGSGPDYQEIHIRRGVVEFLRTARQYPAYRAIRDAAWEVERPAKKKKQRESDGTANIPAKKDGGRRNFLFESLGNQLRETGFRYEILSRCFRPQAGNIAGVFELACLFAGKVLEMTQQQVDAIKELAATISASKQAEKSIERLFKRSGLTNYIRTLTEISDRMARGGEAPLAMDTILRAFDLTNEDDASGGPQSVARELLLIRLIEVLPKERVQALSEEIDPEDKE